MPAALSRPAQDEYFEYYGRYISAVPEGDLLETLSHQLDEMLVLCGSLDESRGNHAYAPGKWTIKEVLGHIIDTERIFAYRALRVARGDPAPLASFDENAYAPESLAGQRTIADLAAEFGHVRRATIALLAPLTAEVGARRGTASGHVVSVRALAWIMAGHVEHHLRLLRERYIG